MIREYRTVREIAGPLLTLEGVRGARPGEVVEILGEGGEVSLGRILEIDEGRALILLYEDTRGLRPDSAVARLYGRSMELSVSLDMLGRAFDGLGRPRDGGPELIPETRLNTDGVPDDPYARPSPEEFIQTGVSAIDGLCPLLRGQTLFLFSSPGLPHARLALQIARGAEAHRKPDEKLALVFCAMGLPFDEAEFFLADFRRTGVIERAVMFLNLANDPAIQRVATPRLAMTAAEYLAFEKDMHVLVIMTDVKNYADALREVSAARDEIPGRYGYPTCMHADLSSIMQRGGRRKGKTGSITLIPIVSMLPDQLAHTVPDTLGQISDGQIVLSRALHQTGIYPPIDPCRSASRTLNRLSTREDHAPAANQIISAYAGAKENNPAFAEAFEKEYIAQNPESARSLTETLNLNWKMLSMLPRRELKRVSDKMIDQYLPEKV